MALRNRELHARNDKNVHYAEDNKQSFYIICKGKIIDIKVKVSVFI